MDTKKTIAGTGIAIILAATGMTGEYYVNPDEKLLGKKYTTNEYKQIRKQIGEIGSRNDGTNPMTYGELKLYAAVLEKESKKCDGKLYPINSNKDIRGQIKKFNELGCPE